MMRNIRCAVLGVFCIVTFGLMQMGCGKAGDSAEGNGGKSPGKPVKIGFVVKQPEEPWFQNEWKFADEAAEALGFELLKIGAADGEKVLAAIDNLSAKGAGGMIICTPDVQLGPAIVVKCKAAGMKLYTVDDQLRGADGDFLDVHHMGISARKIGNAVGNALWKEMQTRGWAIKDTAACAVTFDELDTARERTEGTIETLIAAGFPADKIYRATEKTTDIPGAIDAANILLTKQQAVQQWLVFSMNDEGVLGAVRAMEGRGLTAEQVIGVGIGGSSGADDFEKPSPTGFHGSILISPRRHGYETSEYMFKWLTQSVEPPKLTLTDGILITRENYIEVMRGQGVE